MKMWRAKQVEYPPVGDRPGVAVEADLTCNHMFA